MQREVKFRGICRDNDDGNPTWEYGYIGYCDGQCTISDKDGCGVFVGEGTVGQYAGLKDKNGKEIYEGDILRDSLGWICVVEWDNDNARFLGRHTKSRGDTYICYVGREPKSEIIGNIHDNPELLEQEESK